MANVNVTSNAWTEISITSGTVQNISATADIELSAEQTNNSGVVLKPSELYQWDNETIYARAVTEDTGALRVVNFKKAAGGGGSYVLPVASSSTLGGVKIGSNLVIDESGVLSSTGGSGVNYSTTEQLIGTWIDGKPLYQKTLSLTAPSTSAETMIADITSLNIDRVISINGIVGDDPYWPINIYINNDLHSDVYYENGKLYMRTYALYNSSLYVTLQYTKIAD